LAWLSTKSFQLLYNRSGRESENIIWLLPSKTISLFLLADQTPPLPFHSHQSYSRGEKLAFAWSLLPSFRCLIILSAGLFLTKATKNSWADQVSSASPTSLQCLAKPCHDLQRNDTQHPVKARLNWLFLFPLSS
jgi:hypothetical protein